MLGKCGQTTATENASAETHVPANENNTENGGNNSISTSVANNAASSNLSASGKLHFHERTGTLVKLSNNGRTAERRRPLDEFNNGVVMTHRQIKDNELFEIRIDCLVDKWSGSIEVGITTHNPSTLQFPATMTNMRSGTIMMSGCGILTNGKGTRREYGEYNLDELAEGDRIGLMRKTNANLHYYINGIDQGVAATNVQSTIFGVVDLYGMTVKVTIVDRDDRVEQGLVNHRNNTLIREHQLLNGTDTTEGGTADGAERLMFSTRCGSHAAVINNGTTAHRPNAIEDFDNAVVLTNRPMKPNEMFEVHLDLMVVKWAGSLEIGVTTHTPSELDFPTTMTNVRSGTWMMTGNGVMHNGTTIIDEYGQNLDRLRIGDRVGVVRKDNGTLHFFVNGVDQGVAVSNVPEKTYGVIDLYGQAAQCSIIDHSELADVPQLGCSMNSSSSDLRFHHLHGRNARICNGGLTATRLNAHGEFNDAILMSNRPLCEGEMFEVVLDKMVDKWSGSIEAGVTAIKPEDLEFPTTMTDIDYGTWMLSGSAIMQDGSTIRNQYKCDLDSLGAGTRIGMMRCVDRTVHYFINGEDMGVAFQDIPSNVFAVIDLYGQCAKVTIIPPSSCLSDSVLSPPTHTETLRPSLAEGSEITHCFSPCCGKNITLCSSNVTATRCRGFNNGLVFSSSPLQSNELFEVQVQLVSHQWSGGLQIGFTSMQISESYPTSTLPPYSSLLLDDCDTWLVSGSQVLKNGKVVRDNFSPSLDHLDVDDHVGVKRCLDGSMHVYFNGQDVGIAALNLPKRVYAVVDLYGAVEKIAIVSKAFMSPTPMEASRERRMSFQSVQSKDSLEDIETTNKERSSREFHENHGRNILLSHNNTTAKRTASYNQGVVISRKPLSLGQLFQVRIDSLNPTWSSSLLIGVTTQLPERSAFAITTLGLKKQSWIICGNCIFQNGVKVRGRYGPNLDSLQINHLVGIMIDHHNQLHLYVNGIDQGIAAKDIPQQCYAVVDIYGQCEEVCQSDDVNCLTFQSGSCGVVSLVSSDESRNQVTEANNREKADLEQGRKEKCLRPPLVEQSLAKNCEYQNACIRFKISLGLPEGYFIPEYIVCFCETCHKIRGDEAYYRKGDPPKDYAVPFGWCQFSLRIPANAENSGVLDKWHVAFHGTQPSLIRKIVDCGELLLPGDGGLCTSSKHVPQKNKSKDVDCEASQICFSPTIRYAADNAFTPKFEFSDTKTKRRLFARTVVQVLAQPGAYNSRPQRIGAREPIDGHFNNTDIEWFTKEKGSTILHSLLIKIEGL